MAEGEGNPATNLHQRNSQAFGRNSPLFQGFSVPTECANGYKFVEQTGIQRARRPTLALLAAPQSPYGAH